MSVISGYNCSQEEAAICEACSQAIDDSYVIKLLNETMGPQTVSTLYINNYLLGIITQLSGIYFIRILRSVYTCKKWFDKISSTTWVACLCKYYGFHSRITEFKTDIEDMSFKLCLSKSSKDRIPVSDKSI